MAKKKRKKKLILILAAAVIVVVVLVASFSGSNNGIATVQADLAYVDDIFEKVTASGRIQPQTRVDITAEVSAQIIGVFVNEGDPVIKGQTLLVLDTIQLQSDVAQTRYGLDEISALAKAARTQFEKDSLEYERQGRLFERKLVSETDLTNTRLNFENSQANYNAALAQVKTAQARLEKAEDNLAKTSIKAPMTGVVTYLSAEVGEIAQAQTSYTQGKVLMTIADLSVFEVEVDVDETEIAKVKLGHPAEIRVDALRDTVFAGHVVEIGNSARIEGAGTENYTTNFLVKVRFDETIEAIRPGMSATTDITTAKASDAILIPYAAVIVREFDPDSLESKTGTGQSKNEESEILLASTDNSMPVGLAKSGEDRKKKKKVKLSGVFLVENGKARFAEVATGIADDSNVEVFSGVQPGDTVVSGSFKTLRDLSDDDVVAIEQRSLDKMEEDES